MVNPIIYVFLNKSLHMTTGKAAAQTAHAVAMSMIGCDESLQQTWRSSPHRTVIVLEARDENHMRNIDAYIKERGDFGLSYVIDEGVNEIDEHTVTAIATKIIDKDDENTSLTFSTFKLYKDVIKINMEFEK